MGFGADPQGQEPRRTWPRLFADLQPDDLIKYGMIPEFVGRLPIVVALDELSEDALRRIITEPHNAIIKQYQASLKLDDVELDFEDEAVEAIARKAIDAEDRRPRPARHRRGDS